MKSGERIFSPKALISMIALGLLAFGGAAYFLIYGDTRTDMAIGANSYSYSAFGHRAFAETLRRQGIAVRVSRNNSAAKAGASDLLIIAEPNGNWAGGDAEAYLRPARRVLIVLPKHVGVRDERRRRWVKRVLPRDIEAARAVLHGVAPDGDVSRDAPAAWSLGKFAAVPDIQSPQLMSGAGLEPLIGAGDGRMLVAQITRAERHDVNIWLLSDPDILSNHGLGKGENAELAVALVREMLPPGGGVIIDETVHGFYHSPSLWRHVFELPFAAVTILVAVSLLVLIWAAAGRFGAPRRSAARLEAGGKEGLIEVTARLLDGRQHGHYILTRYREFVLRDIARLLHAPHKFGERQFDDWLKRAATARNIEIGAAGLSAAGLGDANAATGEDSHGAGLDAARAAAKLFAFKQEMVDGPGSHSSAPPRR